MPFLSTPLLYGQPGVYAITNNVTGKMYIGGTVDLRKRLLKHFDFLEKGKHHSPHLQASWAKHGASAFDCKILELTDRITLREREQHWMDLHQSYTDAGYNIATEATGPMAGKTHSPEARKKMREKALLRRHTEEEKRKIGEANSRRVWRPESIEKMKQSLRESAAASPDSEETRAAKGAASRRSWEDPVRRALGIEKLAAAPRHRWTPAERAEIGERARGRKHTEESREKMSVAHRGKPKSEETKRRMSEAAKKARLRKK